MKGSQFDQSYDCMSPSMMPSWEDWISPDVSGIELEAEVPDLPAYMPGHQWESGNITARTQAASSFAGDESRHGSQSSTTNTPSQCCAFRKLDEVLRSLPGDQESTSRKGPCHRFITWVATCRDEDPKLDYSVKRSCPLAKCSFSCNPNDGELIRHILGCSFLKYGKYKCPYHDNEVEVFMIAQQRRTRKSWSRTHSLREAFRGICKLGSKGLHKAFSHSNKKRRYDSLSISSDEINVPEIDGIQSQWIQTNLIHSPSVSNFPTEKRDLVTRQSISSHTRVQSQVREADDNHMISELFSEFQTELPAQESSSELSSTRFSAVYQDIPQIVTTIETSDLETFLPSPLSPTAHVSNERFESPISPQEVAGVVRWAESMEGSSGQHLSLDAAVFGWPMNQAQERVSRATTPLLGSRSPNAKLQAKGLKKLSIDTSVGNARPVPGPKPVSPLTSSEKLASSPDNPEVLCIGPNELFGELRSTVQNTYTFTYAQLSRPPRLPISEEIIAKQLTPSKVFSSGWEAVEMVLQDQLPQKFWWLFSLAQLAFACGQIVWEGQLQHQMDEIADDLRTWSYALRSPRERQCYTEVIEQIFVKESGNISGWSTSHTGSPDNHRDTLSLDGDALLAKLKGGAVIRLCLEFLTTYEFLQQRTDRFRNAAHTGFVSLLQTTDVNDHNVDLLDKSVIRPLLAMKQFQDFGPVIEKASDLLCDYSSTTSRELELYLNCHARYFVTDHALHLQFSETVTQLCSNSIVQQHGTYPRPESYLLQSITVVRRCHRNTNTASYTTSEEQDICNTQYGQRRKYYNPHDISHQVKRNLHQRLGLNYQQSPTQRPFSYTHTPIEYRPFSYIQTPTSASTGTPSTATSGRQSTWTPISANSASSALTPATSTDPFFSSPFKLPWSANDMAYTHPNFPLELSDDYSLLSNEFMNNNSIFSTELPEPDATTETKMSATLSTSTTTNMNKDTGLQGENTAPAPSTTLSEIHSTPISPSATTNTTLDISNIRSNTVNGTSIEPTDSLPTVKTKAMLSCAHCSATFSGKEQFLASNLRRHMRELHSPAARALTCEFCNKAFTRRHNLSVHLRTVHAERRA